ncbi:MAG: hypothetical protein K2P81_14265 [Bacteriovoracaceae bacterium]|nr:hypothetical protein [Bacteriovoracaceae bacterium]
MKYVIALTLAFTSVIALAQTSNVNLKKKKQVAAPSAKKISKPAASAVKQAPVTAPAAPVATSTAEVDNSTMGILKQRLQIRYFSELLGPNFKKWDDNQVDTDAKGNFSRSSSPTNMFNQVSFRWLVAENTRVAIEPRFTTQFGDRNELDKNDDKQVVVQEDHRIRIYKNYWNSENKIWSTTLSFGNRFPTSRASKDGNIIAQPEILHITSAQVTPSLNFSLWNQARYYWFEQKVDRERYRFYTSPSMTYTFNDTYSAYVQYEFEIQHNQPEGKRKYNYTVESLQDLYLGLNINLTQSFTVMPFIRTPTMKKFSDQTLHVGAWFMAALF